MTINTAGTYTLSVTYRLDRFDGGAWQDTGLTDTKAETITVKDAEVEETPSPSPSPTPSSPSLSPTPSPSDDQLPETGDANGMWLWSGLIMVAGILLTGIVIWNKNKKAQHEK
ncbi:MAG: LPXTG cell wall anchor domain-containing protein [Christensenellaceae bacterium]|jgi:LPXTG-motif cell wall-anchored protein